MVEFLDYYRQELVALAAPIVSFLLYRAVVDRSRLTHSFQHGFGYLVGGVQAGAPVADAEPGQQQGPILVDSKVLVLRNGGNAAATDIEVLYDKKPTALNLWPPRDHRLDISPADGRCTLKVDSLAPGEMLLVAVLEVGGTAPIVHTVRSKEAVSKYVQLGLFPQRSQIFVAARTVLVALGSVTLVYGIIKLGAFLLEPSFGGVGG